MAIHATVLRLVKRLFLFVTSAARRIAVPAAQGEIRLRVIEGLRVHQHKLVGAPLVFAVTHPAFLGVDTRYAPVQALLGLDVFRDIFMIVAIETQRILLRLAEELVAVVAIALELGVGLAQLAGHEGLFHGIDHIGGHRQCETCQPQRCYQIPKRSHLIPMRGAHARNAAVEEADLKGDGLHQHQAA